MVRFVCSSVSRRERRDGGKAGRREGGRANPTAPSLLFVPPMYTNLFFGVQSVSVQDLASSLGI